MELSQYKYLIGNIAVIVTALQFLSGIMICRKYISSKSTGETSPLFFLFGLVSCIFWLRYGILIHDRNIILINAFGFILFTTYCAIFLLCTIKKMYTFKTYAIFLVIFLATYLNIMADYDENERINRLGFVACIVTVLTIAAPLSKLVHVIKVQSTEVLPFPTIIMSFLLSTAWFLYGIIQEDTFLIVPNFIGGLLSTFQLLLFLIYPDTPTGPSQVKGSVA